MALKNQNCPKCGAPYNPTKYKCEYCGCYVIESNDNFTDLASVFNELSSIEESKYPGVYVFGKLLGKGEKPILLGAANMFTGPVSAGGKLFLTDKALYFHAHAVNVGRKDSSFELSEITDVSLGTNMLISQNILVTANNKTYRYVVYHGKEWVGKIKEAMNGYDGPAMSLPVSQTTVNTVQTSSSSIQDDYTVELRKLKKLCEEGIITQEEYAIKKRQLLGI